MKPRIIIRADGNSAIGMGHVIRCLALAEMLKSDFEIVFAIQNADEKIQELIGPISRKIMKLQQTNDFTEDADDFLEYVKPEDIVVLDGYNFRTDYQRIIKSVKCKLVCIDDLHSWHHLADVIINHAEGIDKSMYSMEPYTKLFSGLDYVMIRSEFLHSSIQRRINDVKKVFISMGAADIHNLTGKFTEAFMKMKSVDEINIMIGTVNPNKTELVELSKRSKHPEVNLHVEISATELKSMLQRCDVAICPASSISLECCATGIGLISGFTSDNQKGILSGLVKYNSAVNFGDFTAMTVDDISEKCRPVFKNAETFNKHILNQKQMIDGRSPQRLLKIFKDLVPSKLSFRFATESDVDVYFKWANDPAVRSNSYQQKYVDYENHVNWFRSKLASGKCFFYIFVNEKNEKVGQVRIDNSEKEVVIGISIDESFRGKSYGVDMLKMSCGDFLHKNPKSEIVAYIKEENIPSYNIFRKAGFREETTVIEKGHKSFRLIHKLDS